jgi:hypothetical protein
MMEKNEIKIINDKSEIDTCCICLEDMNDVNLCCSMKKCNHTFHAECIHLWVKKTKHKFCPLCRVKGNMICIKKKYRKEICKSCNIKYQDPNSFLKNIKKKSKQLNPEKLLKETLEVMEYLNDPKNIYKSFNIKNPFSK